MEQVIYGLGQEIYKKSQDNVLSVATSILNQIVGDTTEVERQEKELTEELNRIKANRENLLDKYLDNKIEDGIYSSKDSKLKQQMTEIENRLKRLVKEREAISDKENRIKELEEEIKVIADVGLSIKNIKKHIEKIIVYPNHMIIHFDIFDPVKIEIKQVNYRKKEYHICL